MVPTPVAPIPSAKRVLNFRVKLHLGALMFRLVLVWMMSLASLSVVANAQSPDIPEPGSVEAIAAATTDPHFRFAVGLVRSPI